jgi:cell division protein DivIC
MDKFNENSISKIWSKLASLNKFLLTAILFAVWIIFIDRNNLIQRISISDEYQQLKHDKDYYLAKIKSDSIKLHNLKTDKANLEKFVREQYFMKKANEDVFVILEKEAEN